jgi:hypothetical protein
MVRGAYHFGHANADATAQAQHFVNTVVKFGGFKMSHTLPLVLDIEVNDNVSKAALWAWTQRFCVVVKQMTGRAPIIYTVYLFHRFPFLQGSVLDELLNFLRVITFGLVRWATRLTTWDLRCGSPRTLLLPRFRRRGRAIPSGRFADIGSFAVEISRNILICNFLQYTDKGKVPGVSGNVDTSYFAGSAMDLQALCYP